MAKEQQHSRPSENSAPAAGIAEAEQPVAAPPTAEQTAAAEVAMGLVPAGAPTPAQRAAVPRPALRIGIVPETLEDAWRLAQMMARSELVPKNFRNHPEDVLVAVQMGVELGFAPMQALQSIAVINGRPSVWGDGFLALIMSSSLYKDHDEYYEVDGHRVDGLTLDDMKKDSTTAVCTFWRHGKATPVTRRFSVGQAKKAGLWGKSGPWTDYPDRMMSMRPRSWAGRDAFPDLLRGMRTTEEALDLPAEPEPEAPPQEVRRRSETPIERATNEGSVGTGKDRNIVDVAKVSEDVLDAAGVQDVEQFAGGFTVTLTNGVKVDTIDMADAIELEKFKGTKHKVRLTVTRQLTDGPLLLKSFAIAD